MEKEDDDEEEDPVAHPDTHPSPVTGHLEEHRIRVEGFVISSCWSRWIRVEDFCYFFVLISMD